MTTEHNNMVKNECGFGVSLVGEQVWPPRISRIGKQEIIPADE